MRLWVRGRFPKVITKDAERTSTTQGLTISLLLLLLLLHLLLLQDTVAFLPNALPRKTGRACQVAKARYMLLYQVTAGYGAEKNRSLSA